MKIALISSLSLCLSTSVFADPSITIQIEPNTQYTVISAFRGIVKDAKPVGSFIKRQEKVPEEWWLSPFESDGALKWSESGAAKNAVMQIETNDVTGLISQTSERNAKILKAALSNSVPLSTETYPPHHFYEASDFTIRSDLKVAKLYRQTLNELRATNSDPYLLREFDDFLKNKGQTPTIDGVLERIQADPEYKLVPKAVIRTAVLENINYLRGRYGIRPHIRKWHYGAAIWLPSNISLIDKYQIAQPKNGTIAMSYDKNRGGDSCDNNTDIAYFTAYWNRASKPEYWDLNDRVFLSQLADKSVRMLQTPDQLEEVRRALVSEAYEAQKQVNSACAVELAAKYTVWTHLGNGNSPDVAPYFRVMLDSLLEKSTPHAEVPQKEFDESVELIRTLLRSNLKDEFNRYIDSSVSAWLAGELMPSRNYEGVYLKLTERGSWLYTRVEPAPGGNRFSLISLREWASTSPDSEDEILSRQPDVDDPLLRIEQMQARANLRANATKLSIAKYGLNSFYSAISTSARDFIADQVIISATALDMLKDREASIERNNAMMFAYRYGYAYVPDDSVITALHKHDGDFAQIGDELFSVVPRFQFNASFELSGAQVEKLALTPQQRRNIMLKCLGTGAQTLGSKRDHDYTDNLPVELIVVDVRKDTSTQDAYQAIATLTILDQNRTPFNEVESDPVDAQKVDRYRPPLLSAGMKCTTDLIAVE